MAYADRRARLAALEEVRQSKVLAYVLSDRETFPPGVPGFTANLDTSPQLILADHLRSFGKVERLDLLLYTRGGATDSVWPFVSLLREHCEQLAVLVPFRAHSGGTLICLGADEVVMLDMAELSPIDPTTGNQFNPPDPANPANRFGISVEDVISYFELAEKLAEAKDSPEKLSVLSELTRNVHPLALGNVQRVYQQIRRLAAELLKLHLKDSDKQISAIVKALTEQFYSHVHAITRREAIPLLGEWVREPTPEEAAAIGAVFDEYVSALELKERFNLPELMGDTPWAEIGAVGAFLESTESSHLLSVNLQVSQRPALPPGIQLQVPPGGALPLAGWASRNFDFGIKRVGWKVNEEGV